MSAQFWKPGTVAPGSSLDRASETEGNIVQSAPAAAYCIQAQRENLPIYQHREINYDWESRGIVLTASLIRASGEKLLYCIEKYGVTIVVAQTGTGKTTRAF